jgi:hypothetical protein
MSHLAYKYKPTHQCTVPITNYSRHLINKVRVSLSWQLDQKFRKAQEHEEHIETLTFPEAKLNQIEAISSPFSVIQR